MAFNSYDELFSAIADYIMRPDAPIASFIALGQSDIAPRIKHYEQETKVTLTSADNMVTLPADFQEARRVVVDGALATPTSIYRTDFSAGCVYYFQRGKRYEFVPAKDVPREVELTYYARIPFITVTNQTNWLTDYNFGNAIFHASLVRAYRWMKDKDAEAMEKASLEEALAGIATDNSRAVNSGNQFEIDFGGPLF
ncbi:hypothetical protein [Sinorhizobium sp. BG8]|uniref:phage adaptor protein n=1 Tax=Sinorhizobium sp. BG8 TaxID=2613773 RepID=UPI00193CA0B1|nr:hypothetical protein [Sinorhizobium sp. BG8]QRM54743.1 hypothetical protein F3Y30_09455 [Sinorhizobium sp. BG8]